MIVGRCTATGCNVLTIGPRCVEHDAPVTRTFTRGRPYSRLGSASAPQPQHSTPAPAADSLAAMRTGAVLVRAS
jgi:hypothetical protein